MFSKHCRNRFHACFVRAAIRRQEYERSICGLSHTITDYVGKLRKLVCDTDVCVCVCACVRACAPVK
jgi:hypothetical protein